MALLSYGLPREYAFFNEQHMIEEVQLLTRIFYPDSPLYPEWRSSVDFASTGETFGVVVQVPGSGQAARDEREGEGKGKKSGEKKQGGETEGGGAEEEEEREEEEEENEDEDDDEDEENGELFLEGLTESARWLAKQTLQHPPGKVTTEQEKQFLRRVLLLLQGVAPATEM